MSCKKEQLHKADDLVRIPLQRSGEHFLVPLSINGKAPILLLLDTGASITLVQLDPTPRSPLLSTSNNAPATISLQTANGKITVPLIASNQVQLGGFQLDHIKIAYISQSVTPRAQGLLGMNILKHFDFFIDQQELTLNLSPRQASAKY